MAFAATAVAVGPLVYLDGPSGTWRVAEPAPTFFTKEPDGTYTVWHSDGDVRMGAKGLYPLCNLRYVDMFFTEDGCLFSIREWGQKAPLWERWPN